MFFVNNRFLFYYQISKYWCKYKSIIIYLFNISNEIYQTIAYNLYIKQRLKLVIYKAKL
jgi:hypothetical protein